MAPAPDHAKKWMRTHLNVFGDLPIKQLCISGSHDASTYDYRFGTTVGTRANVMTQV
jgi:hypothetical protein